MNSRTRYTWPNPSPERLRELRAMSGEQYWQSHEWRMMRRYIIARDSGRCKLCNKNFRLSVHHRTYARTRGTETPGDLITLCSWCHEAFHKNRKLYKDPTKRYVRKERRRKKRIRAQTQAIQRKRLDIDKACQSLLSELDREFAEITRRN